MFLSRGSHILLTLWTLEASDKSPLSKNPTQPLSSSFSFYSLMSILTLC